MKRNLMALLMLLWGSSAFCSSLLYVHGTFENGKTYTSVVKFSDREQADKAALQLGDAAEKKVFERSAVSGKISADLISQFRNENPQSEKFGFIPEIGEIIDMPEEEITEIRNSGWNTVNRFFTDGENFTIRTDSSRILKSVTVVWERTLEKAAEAKGSFYADGDFCSREDISSDESSATVTVNRRVSDVDIRFTTMSIFLPCHVQLKRYKVEYSGSAYYPPVPPPYPHHPSHPGYQPGSNWTSVHCFYEDGDRLFISTDPYRKIRSVTVVWSADKIGCVGRMYADGSYVGTENIYGNDSIDEFKVYRRARDLEIRFGCSYGRSVYVKEYRVEYENDGPFAYEPYFHQEY